MEAFFVSKKYELIVFDLDGTLIDTSPGIFNSVRHAEKEMGFTPISNEQLRMFVGPPPIEMYMKMYGVESVIAAEATKKHREYGRTKAIFEAVVYPGIEDVLKYLKHKNYKLAVATLKSQKIAEMVLENYGLHVYFDVIVGMDEKESFTKCMTIQIAKEKLNIEGNVLMIGDSEYDYIGANEAGVDFLGVLYGFGFDNKIQYPFPVIENVLHINTLEHRW